MESLPSSIEASLSEAGFSPTEILILKRLLEEEALTLRQLALKTGKGTGVLDQAMCKLLKKGIVNKENINENPKFVLHSLHSIMRWMESDMAEKQEMMARRHRNFETFIATISVDKGRPDLEHFEGQEGIEKAYRRLLDQGKEMLIYLPITCKEEEDPLRDFRVQYFRERRKRSIFQRVIAHDTSLGRRFQSRDVFEYRKTLLVPEDVCPMNFEQILIGDTYACIDHAAQKACFIRFPHLAQSERAFFDALWQNPKREIVLQEGQSSEAHQPIQESVNLKTRVLSCFREFILSPKSIITLGLFAIISAGLTYGMYRYTQHLTLERMKDQIKAIASTAASQFNPDDLAQLQVEEDWKKPVWAKVVNQLKEVRVNNENIKFVYLFRKSTRNPGTVEFVADSHSLNPYANTDDDPSNDVDANGDGKIDPEGEDKLSPPTDPYPTAPREAIRALELTDPSTNEAFYEDGWGKVISGYAPIRNARGDIVAVLAVDNDAKKLDKFTQQVFRPVLFFLLCFGVFVIFRFAALNKFLLKEVWVVFKKKRVIAILLSFVLLVLVLLYSFYLSTFNTVILQTQERLKSIAATGAPQFSAEDIAQIRWAPDMQKPAYQRIFQTLNDLRLKNPGIKFAYVLRPTNNPDIFEFVADADTNHQIPFYLKDFNMDGTLNDVDEAVPPGTSYYVDPLDNAQQALNGPTHSSDFISDQWGSFMSGLAPIKNGSGKTIAIFGVDMMQEDIQKIAVENFLKVFDDVFN